jgi:hypothetical protein
MPRRSLNPWVENAPTSKIGARDRAEAVHHAHTHGLAG